MELIVVLVVLGLLAAIAIPTFLTITNDTEWHVLTVDAQNLGDDALALAAFHHTGAAQVDATVTPSATIPMAKTQSAPTYVEVADAKDHAFTRTKNLTFIPGTTPSDYAIRQAAWGKAVCLQASSSYATTVTITRGVCATGAGSAPATTTTPTPTTRGSRSTNTVAAALVGVSCPTTIADCVAVGYQHTGHPTAPFSMTRTNGKWADPQPVDPAGVTDAKLTRVSCWAATQCLAVGTTWTTGGHLAALAEVYDAGTWALLTTSSFVPATANGGLRGVSCMATGWCMVAGWYTSPSAPPTPIVEVYAAGSWSPETITTVHGPAQTTTVSCVAVSGCVLGGTSTTGATIYTDANGSWSTASLLPIRAFAHTYPVVPSVSCTTLSTCTALVDGHTPTTTPPLTFTEAGGVWGTQFALPHVPTTYAENARQVSCASQTSCAIAGFGPENTHTKPPVPNLFTGHGVAWTHITKTLPKNATAGGFSGNSCSTDGCVMVGWKVMTGTTHPVMFTVKNPSYPKTTGTSGTTVVLTTTATPPVVPITLPTTLSCNGNGVTPAGFTTRTGFRTKLTTLTGSTLESYYPMANFPVGPITTAAGHANNGQSNSTGPAGVQSANDAGPFGLTGPKSSDFPQGADFYSHTHAAAHNKTLNVGAWLGISPETDFSMANNFTPSSQSFVGNPSWSLNDNAAAHSISAEVTTTAGSSTVTVPYAALPKNTAAETVWHFISMTYTGTFLKLWVDGTQVGSASTSGTLIDTASTLRFGARNTGTNSATSYADAWVSQMYVASSSLAGTQGTLYSAGASGTPVIYHDKGEGTEVLSPASHTGTQGGYLVSTATGDSYVAPKISLTAACKTGHGTSFPIVNAAVVWNTQTAHGAGFINWGSTTPKTTDTAPPPVKTPSITSFTNSSGTAYAWPATTPGSASWYAVVQRDAAGNAAGIFLIQRLAPTTPSPEGKITNTLRYATVDGTTGLVHNPTSGTRTLQPVRTTATWLFTGTKWKTVPSVSVTLNTQVAISGYDPITGYQYYYDYGLHECKGSTPTCAGVTATAVYTEPTMPPSVVTNPDHVSLGVYAPNLHGIVVTGTKTGIPGTWLITGAMATTTVTRLATESTYKDMTGGGDRLYDPAINATVVLGPSGTHTLWALEGTTPTNAKWVAVATPPSDHTRGFNAILSYDGSNLVLFGGATSNMVHGTTWVLTGSTWRKTATGYTAPERAGPVAG